MFNRRKVQDKKKSNEDIQYIEIPNPAYQPNLIWEHQAKTAAAKANTTEQENSAASKKCKR